MYFLRSEASGNCLYSSVSLSLLGDDGAFCLSCVLFGHRFPGKASKITNLFSKPVSRWNDAAFTFKRHDEGEVGLHAQTNPILFALRAQMSGSAQPIELMLERNLKKEIDQNKYKLKDLGLPIEDCRGQGYDGAGAVAGCVKGLAAQILKLNSKALYTHCYSHRLNLSVCDSLSDIEVKKVLNKIKDVTNFINISQTCNIPFEETVRNSLETGADLGFFKHQS
ncbi:uncharacterized protein LOC124459430 [Xenia sp. Carnegie-2017]|uniref:uncharacterized protein LOC124459430 n=1 Tax=Xenia sp. Carnegie-2017 TaxID=2897299 RepID=UPI001F04738C|nr:uncharacterized protein LOC124459430 [Xenia sp. Carnegie-2017]